MNIALATEAEYRENGGWVYMNRAGDLSAVMKKRDANDQQFHVDLSTPPVLPGKIAVATIHSHQDDAGPSGGGGMRGDRYQAEQDKVLGILIRPTIYETFGPDSGFWQQGLPARCKKG